MPYNVTINKYIKINKGGDLDTKVDSTEIKENLKNAIKALKINPNAKETTNTTTNTTINDKTNDTTNTTIDKTNDTTNTTTNNTTIENNNNEQNTFLKNVSNYLSHI